MGGGRAPASEPEASGKAGAPLSGGRPGPPSDRGSAVKRATAPMARHGLGEGLRELGLTQLIPVYLHCRVILAPLGPRASQALWGCR